MTATNHVLTGAVIAVTVQSPALALPLAILSHFVLDALPHFGINEHISSQFYMLLGADVLVAGTILGTLLVLQPAHWLLIVACGIAAASPDLMWLPRFLKELHSGKVSKRSFGLITNFHHKIQWAEGPGFLNVIMEILWFGSMLTLLASKLIV